MRSSSQRTSLVVIALVVMVLGLMVGRAASESRAELATAASYRQSGQLVRAIEHYRRALRWSFPLNPYTGAAISALQECASESEAAGDPSTALLAWRSLLGGLSATRVLYEPESAATQRAKAQIARLEASAVDAPARTNASAEQEAEYLRQLEVDVAPDPLWGSVLLIGFATWIVSLVSLTRRGFDESGRLRWGPARASVWGALGGLIAFLLGLSFA